MIMKSRDRRNDDWMIGKRFVIIFGKTGAGKSYTAKLFEKELGFYFYDADQDLTAAMREAIATGHVFTDTMRTEYFKIIAEKIGALLESYPKIVLAQGLFKNKHRRQLAAQFPFAEFIWIDAADSILKERILQRNNEITWEYAQKINQLFEIPDFICKKIVNNGGAEELLIKVRELGNCDR